ncbi:hypothetical protein Bbelb_256070 [Branchiostoma belcheri]|nr:hypothetical protein Bbelb_256070 [Branchiostoma belcheri]
MCQRGRCLATQNVALAVGQAGEAVTYSRNSFKPNLEKLFMFFDYSACRISRLHQIQGGEINRVGYLGLGISNTRSDIMDGWKRSKLEGLCGEPAKKWRPIALLPTVAKVLERLAHNRLYSRLTENKLLNVNQSGFRKGEVTVLRRPTITNAAEEEEYPPDRRRTFLLG